jgi:ATP-binding cassette, subfamily G (WHITE), member 2, PDR
VLADRISTGIVRVEKLVDIQFQDEGFTRKIGYAQQQDLHIHTSTAQEALQFSALLRQPNKYSKADKFLYAEQVIDLLDMGPFADAVIGVPGEGDHLSAEGKTNVS